MKFSLLIGVALLALPWPASADTVRPAIGKSLQQAETLIQRGNYNGALVQVNKAAAVTGLTPYETLLIAQLRGTAAAGAGQYRVAATAYQSVLASGAEPPATQTQLIQAIAGFYYQAQDYTQTEIWVTRYIAAKGQDPRTHALLAQSYYAQGNYPAAEQAVLRQRDLGQKLPEPELQILASAAQKSNDSAAYFTALIALLQAYPSPQYWSAAIALVTGAADFPDALALDAYRLRRATGTLDAASDYEDYTERAILGGDAGEANAVITQGFSSGVLNDATDSGHASRLRILAGKNTASPTQAAFIAQAKASGSRLDLGIAYFNAGDAASAKTAFASIENGSDSESSLARLWEIRAQQPAQPQ